MEILLKKYPTDSEIVYLAQLLGPDGFLLIDEVDDWLLVIDCWDKLDPRTQSMIEIKYSDCKQFR